MKRRDLFKHTLLAAGAGVTIGPRHSWDPNVPTPMAEVLGLTPRQIATTSAKPA